MLRLNPMGDFNSRVPLGRTGIEVSRLGLGASYGAPAAAYREAFDRGVNYFYWGSRRRGAMGEVLRDLCATRRDDVVLVLQSYARFGAFVKRSVESGLRKLGTDYCDVLLLGWFNSEPACRIIEAAESLRERGLVKATALSSHHRPLFPTLLDDQRYGAWYVRYNAVHRGAEQEVFPAIADRGRAQRPGVVSYTNTRWGHLCDPKRTPPGEPTPSGTDCYRFALSRPEVDVAIAGPDNSEHMHQALAALDAGPLDEEKLAWMRRVGDHIYGRDATTNMRD